jgi:hypothetical protein
MNGPASAAPSYPPGFLSNYVLDSSTDRDYKTTQERRTNMGAQPVPVYPLSHGDAIEYKAYARTFGSGGPAVLSLIATCSYPTGGFTIFFGEGPGPDQFELLENVPGIVNELVTYYMASWTSGQPLVRPPTQVKIKDAWGEHRVEVKPWR